MNVADSRRLASELEHLDLEPADRAEDADLIVLNTCVVRQQPEDRAVNRLMNLRPIKERRPETIVALMGCLVGVNNPIPSLAERFPFVDLFLAPSDSEPLLDLVLEREAARLEIDRRTRQDSLQDGELTLPLHEQGLLAAAHLPVVLGCSHACSYCVIPHRRGPERSRLPAEIISEANSLAGQGVKEITLLGQIVDRYGLDLEKGITLAGLMRQLHEIESLERIRFLTSHPNWMTDELLHVVAELPRVCEHIEVPIQSGDDDILRAMKRGYSVDDYRQLIDRIRAIIPGVAIHTDIIVGFPGETEAHFKNSYDLLEELKLDKAHIARYSPRPNTLSARRLVDNVAPEEKERRRKALDDLQGRIVGEINQRFVGQDVEVLVEAKQKGRWRGRTRGNKLVFFEDPRELQRELVKVRVEWAGPWSMQGRAVQAKV